MRLFAFVCSFVRVRVWLFVFFFVLRLWVCSGVHVFAFAYSFACSCTCYFVCLVVGLFVCYLCVFIRLCDWLCYPVFVC